MPAISTAMANDRERFERIYRENFRTVLRFAAARLDPDRAKDVATETFLVSGDASTTCGQSRGHGARDHHRLLAELQLAQTEWYVLSR